MGALKRLGEVIQQNTLAPCRVAASGNVVLSGLKNIDAKLVIPGDRVLVRGQTDLSENGIYIVSAGAWTRATDWNETSDVSSGSLVAVYEGSLEGLYHSSFAGTLNVGTTQVAWNRYDLDVTSVKDVTTLLADTSTANYAEGDYIVTDKEGFRYLVAASTATNHHVTTAGGSKLYVQPDRFGRYDVQAFGAKGDGVTDDGPLINTVTLAAFNDGLDKVFFPRPSTSYLVNTQLLLYSRTKWFGAGAEDTTIQVASDYGNNFILRTNVATTGVLDTFEQEDIELFDLHIKGHGNTLATDAGDAHAPLTRLWKINGLKVCRVKFSNHRYIGLSLGGCKNFSVQHCEFDTWGRTDNVTGSTLPVNEGGAALWIAANPTDNTKSSFGDVSFNYFHDATWSAIYNFGDDVSICDNRMETVQEAAIYARRFDAGTNNDSKRQTYMRNTIRGVTENYIAAAGMEVGGEGMLIAHNKISDCAGPGIDITDTGKNNAVFNNLLEECCNDTRGGYLNFGSITGRTTGASSETMKNLAIYGNMVRSTSAPAGIFLTQISTSDLITGISVYDNDLIDAAADADNNLSYDPAILGDNCRIYQNKGARYDLQNRGDVRDILQEIIPTRLHNDILNKTSTADLTSYFVKACEAGGVWYGPDGLYNIAEAGADAGGAYATISKSLTLNLAAGAIIKAGAGLDNDMIRLTCDSSSYTEDRVIDIKITGGVLDQTEQKVSTVVPFRADYPPSAALNGTSATTSGIALFGEVDDGGTPKPGFNSATIIGMQINASSTGHWESAGGDQGIFIGGTKHIHVSGVTAKGSRDLAIYCSGLSSGSIEGGSCYIGQNQFYGCMYGASTKRLMSNVQMVNNIGFNTAVVCTATDVTTSGNNVLITNNIGHGAWMVVRATGGAGIMAAGNMSYSHGHLREDGSVPTTVFTANNACVRFEGVNKSKATNNHLADLNTGFSGQTCAVRLSDDDGVLSTNNFVHGNTCNGAESVVIEDSGEANGNECWGNVGKGLTGLPVALDGDESLDRDGPIYEINSTTTHTGTGSTTTVATGTIKQNTMRRRDRIKIVAAGSISGTAGTKKFLLKLGTATSRDFTLLPATTTGEWMLEAYIEMNTLSSQRFFGQLIANGESGAFYNSENRDFTAGDIDVALQLQLGNTADSITVNTFSLRLE